MTTLDPVGADTLERLLAADPNDVEQVRPVDSVQEALTARHILPVLPDLAEEFTALRASVDATLRSRYAERQGGLSVDDYPKGFCLPITVEAVRQYEQRLADRPSRAGRAVLAFRRDGGHVGRIWGVLRDRYFQNALQIGSIYFDVANDTVDVTKPKVEYMPLAESGFVNVESYEAFADIAERYWECEVYPNFHYPRLAPLLPVLVLTADGGITLQSPAYSMQRLNLDDAFRPAERFLCDGRWASRRLPAEHVERIEAHKAARLGEGARTPREGVAPSEVAATCAQYRADRVYRSRRFLSRMLNAVATLSVPPRH